MPEVSEVLGDKCLVLSASVNFGEVLLLLLHDGKPSNVTGTEDCLTTTLVLLPKGLVLTLLALFNFFLSRLFRWSFSGSTMEGKGFLGMAPVAR